MRLKNVEINLESGKIDVGLMDMNNPCVVVISGGRAKLSELPSHGETKVITHQGKVRRVRFEEGEEF